MKKLVAIIGMCMIGFMARANNQDFEQSLSQALGNENGQAAQGQAVKQWDPEKLMACIEKHLAERQAEEKEAAGKGRTDIAAALQKLITDLTNMKAALEKKDKEAFKTANEQRKKDREALEELRKSDREARKNGKTGSTTQPSTPKL